jgi:hypothetical protein
MTRYYDELAVYERNGFDIIVDKSYEDMHPRDSFDDSCHDIDEICKDIDRGHLEWFMLRVRVLVEGLELAQEHLGGCLYEDPKEILTDGTAEDFIDMALTHAKSQVYRLSKTFAGLSEQVDREGINA